jgi:hypothetical protein
VFFWRRTRNKVALFVNASACAEAMFLVANEDHRDALPKWFCSVKLRWYYKSSSMVDVTLGRFIVLRLCYRRQSLGEASSNVKLRFDCPFARLVEISHFGFWAVLIPGWNGAIPSENPRAFKVLRGSITNFPSWLM